MYLSPFPNRAALPLLFSCSTTLLPLFIVLFVAPPCSAYVDWLYPPASSSRALAYNYNDVVYFTWASNFTAPSLTLWCAADDNYYTLYTANVTANGTDPQSFPYSSAFNQTCHMALYCHGSPDCGPRGQSPDFALAHNQAAAPQTWGQAATASVGQAVAATATGTSTSSTSSAAAAKTASATAENAAAVTGTGAGRGPAISSARNGGLSVGAKVGIGVGAAVGAVVIGAALWVCAVKWQGRRRDTHFDTPEMSGQEYANHTRWAEQPPHEMGGEGRIDELHGTPQAELSSVASPVRYG